jgi:hypothetical protein
MLILVGQTLVSFIILEVFEAIINNASESTNTHTNSKILTCPNTMLHSLRFILAHGESCMLVNAANSNVFISCSHHIIRMYENVVECYCLTLSRKGRFISGIEASECQSLRSQTSVLCATSRSVLKCVECFCTFFGKIRLDPYTTAVT